MLDLLIFNDSYALTVFIAASFLLSGIIKGILGMGMPAILMVTLTLIMPPIAAIPLIALPMLFVNIFQFLRGPAPMNVVKGYWVFAVSTVVVLAITAYNITAYPEEILLASVGVAMVLFSVPSLYGWRFEVGPHPIWQAIAGGISGILGGLSTVWSPPVVMYLMGRGVQKDDFIGITGFLFMVGSITLALTLSSINLITFEVMVPSLAGLVIALLGFRLGEWIRGYINRETFRKMILVAFLILGARLVVISFF